MALCACVCVRERERERAEEGWTVESCIIPALKWPKENDLPIRRDSLATAVLAPELPRSSGGRSGQRSAQKPQRCEAADEWARALHVCSGIESGTIPHVEWPRRNDAPILGPRYRRRWWPLSSPGVPAGEAVSVPQKSRRVLKAARSEKGTIALIGGRIGGGVKPQTSVSGLARNAVWGKVSEPLERRRGLVV